MFLTESLSSSKYVRLKTEIFSTVRFAPWLLLIIKSAVKTGGVFAIMTVLVLLVHSYPSLTATMAVKLSPPVVLPAETFVWFANVMFSTLFKYQSIWYLIVSLSASLVLKLALTVAFVKFA